MGINFSGFGRFMTQKLLGCTFNPHHPPINASQNCGVTYEGLTR